MADLFQQSKYIPKNPSILRLIHEYQNQYHPVFLKVKSEWNQVIREFLRDATGLKLHSRKTNKGSLRDSGVDVIIKPDFNDEFIKLVDKHYPDLDFQEFMALRELKKAADYSIRYFNSDSHPSEELSKVIAYCESYFEKYNLEDIVQKLFAHTGKSKDIWGCYPHSGRCVEIYFLPLIIFSNLKGLQIEFALVKVLVHELAHAYHHLGKDKDERVWDAFGEANLNIVEGLAQYYTERFVDEFGSTYPKLIDAYKAMVSCQSGPYRVHEEWSKKYTQEHVKHSLIQTRRNSISQYDGFLYLLDEIRKNLN